MRAGYMTLLGAVLAYSAYQGTAPSKSALPPSESRATGDAGKATGSATANLPGTDPFPSLSGGIYPMAANSDLNTPCNPSRSAICSTNDLRELIMSYFQADSGNDAAYLDQHWNVPKAYQNKIQFVIASLPDPVHTHMALLFDRSIETIQRSAQANGYLFSRAWMPWDISTHTESSDFTVRLAQTQYRDALESLPGLMIFQKSDPASAASPAILFVFVVGETPTGGLHIEQFQNALNIRESILGPDSVSGEMKVLRIFGPAFSGSLLSLDAVLYAQPPGRRFSTILVRSGSISSYRAVHNFCEMTRQQWPDGKNGPGPTPTHIGRPDFATFQFSDEYQEFYLSEYLPDRQDLHSHIAVLSEDETALGNQDVSRNQEAAQPAVNSVSQPDPCPSEPGPVKFKRLYFPREIAQLRDAYQQNIKAQSSADTTKAHPQNGLTLSLGATGNDDDTVATYSPSQTPLSQESILQAIVATLRKEHARLVLIRASDPLDVVFLCRYLRQNYPQARLLTSGADLLMIHDFYDPRFHGILALTPYPILTAADFPYWSSTQSDNASKAAMPEPVQHLFPFPPWAQTKSPDDVSKSAKQEPVQRLFPDSFSVGDFNAFQSLLAPGAVSEPEKLLPPAEYEQFGRPSFLQAASNTPDPEPWRAHLWLAMVGREGYWPVAILDDPQPNTPPPDPSVRVADAPPILPSPYTVHFTVGWTIFWLPVVGLTLGLALLLLFPPTSHSEILARFGEPSSPARNGLLFTASVLLVVVQTLFVFPSIVWLVRFGQVGQEWAAPLDGLGLVMNAYIFSVGLLAMPWYKGLRRRNSLGRNSRVRARVSAFLYAAAIVGILLFTWCKRSAEPPNNFGAFLYRYINVGSGVSFLLPLLFLLLAWIWWVWQSLTGVVSTEEKDIRLPHASRFDHQRVPDAYQRVRLKALASRGEWPWKSLGAVPIGKFGIKIALSSFAGLVVILVLMSPPEIAEAVESQPYKIAYWILLYSCLLLVFYLLTQIVALWLEFRTLLRAIESVPFRRAFSALKDLTWKPLWKLAGSGRTEFSKSLVGELDAVVKLQKCLPDGALTDAIKGAKDTLEEVCVAAENAVPVDSDSMRKLRESFGALQAKLAATASEALIYASQQWQKEADQPPETDSAAKDSPAKDSGVKPAAAEPEAKDPITRTIERFLCFFYMNIILVPLRRLQTLILAMAGVFVFVLVSYSSYPFESRESFHVLLISLFFAISLVVGIVYGQMFSNPLLSRITNTTPGELGLDFWVRIGTFVFVPLLSLLSVQFPEVNNFLFSWLQPALQSLK
jgi:hypothetical protein